MKAIILALVLVASVFGQANTYVVYREDSLSAAAGVLTLQQAASPTKTATMVVATVYCSVACDVSIEIDGTAATATEVTPTPIAPTTAAATLKAYRSSDVGVGTVINKVTIPAGQTVPISFTLTSQQIVKTAGKNLSLRTSSITGTARYTVIYTEQ